MIEICYYLQQKNQKLKNRRTMKKTTKKGGKKGGKGY
jgi:hypothetical protein